jgi:acyl-CoA thioester hydrolase
MPKETTFTYRIYYEDTDAGGVVYYANYLKFFERARTDFFRARNIFQSQLAQKEDSIFVVRKCSLEYKVPAKLDDLVTITTIINNIGGASIKMHQEMTRKEDEIGRAHV